MQWTWSPLSWTARAVPLPPPDKQVSFSLHFSSPTSRPLESEMLTRIRNVYKYICMETTHFTKWLPLAEGTCNNQSPSRPFLPSRGGTAFQPPLRPPCERCTEWQRIAMIGTIMLRRLTQTVAPWQHGNGGRDRLFCGDFRICRDVRIFQFLKRWKEISSFPSLPPYGLNSPKSFYSFAYFCFPPSHVVT